LTDDEVHAALHRLPYWSGDSRTLWRVIELPPSDLDRVLERIHAMRADVGRGPYIGRRGRRSAVLALWTRSVDAVTALDVDTARRIDQIVGTLGEGRP
jgi:pterin-4a-carbinolamine dehydratase